MRSPGANERSTSGQTPLDADGKPVHEGDMAGQINQCLDNIETVLAGADMTFANLVRIQSFTTDMDLFFEHAHELARLSTAGSQHTSTVIGVSRLAFPPFLIEIEAIAVA